VEKRGVEKRYPRAARATHDSIAVDMSCSISICGDVGAAAVAVVDNADKDIRRRVVWKGGAEILVGGGREE